MAPDLPGHHLHPVVHGAELPGAVRVQHLVRLFGGAVPYLGNAEKIREDGAGDRVDRCPKISLLNGVEQTGS